MYNLSTKKSVNLMIFIILSLFIMTMTAFASEAQFFAKVKEGKNWGLMDATGNVVIPARFDSVFVSASGIISVRGTDKKWGIYDQTGKVIMPVEFNTIMPITEGRFIASKQGKYRVYDESGNIINQNEFDDIWFLYEDLISVKIGKEWGAIDKSGNIVIPAQYANAFIFSEGLAAVKKGKTWEYIDKEGKSVISGDFKEASAFSEGLAKTVIGGKVSFIDKDGNIVFTSKYKDVSSFHDGIAQVKVKVSKISPLGIIGNLVLNTQIPITSHADFVKHPERYRVNMFDTVEQNEKRGFINRKGELVITTKYEFVGPYYKNGDGLILVISDGKTGYVDKTGAVVVPFNYDELTAFSEDIAIAKNDDKVQFIDRTGTAINKGLYNDAKLFSNGIAAYKVGEKWGYIRKDGIPVARPRYDEANFFTENVAAVRIADRWQLINRSGDVVTELVGVAKVLDYVDGFAAAEKDGKWGMIDENGIFVIQPQYNEVATAVVVVKQEAIE